MSSLVVQDNNMTSLRSSCHWFLCHHCHGYCGAKVHAVVVVVFGFISFKMSVDKALGDVVVMPLLLSCEYLLFIGVVVVF